MIRPLRTRHRYLVTLLAIAAALMFALALTTRSGATRRGSVSVRMPSP